MSAAAPVYAANAFTAMNEPITDGTADEFMDRYANDSGVTVAFLRQHGRVPRFVSGCADHDLPHWEMGRETDDDFDRRNEIDPPAC